MNPNGKPKSRQASPLLSGWDAWAIMTSAQPDPPPLNGKLAAAPPHVQRLVKLLPKLPGPEARNHALQTLYAILSEQDRKTLLDVDLKAGEPPDIPVSAQGRPLPARSACTDDMGDSPDDEFLWRNRLVRGHLNIVASEPKIGKTMLFLELARRLWVGEPFPDEEKLILPAGTRTLWVCGDKHQKEVRKRRKTFGLPGDVIRFCTRPETPYGNTSLDDDDTIELMEHFAKTEHPGIIFIDTIWRATAKKMKLEEDVNALFDPIIEIAQKTNTTIFGASHLSKDGDTLGRRLDAVARSIMKLYQPDPENQPNRRKLTTIGNYEKPDDLGMTIFDDHIEFDHSPPKAPEPERKFTGRPKSESIRAREFLFDTLQAGPMPLVDVNKKWAATGGNRKTLHRVKEEMIEDKELETATLEDDGPKMLRLIDVELMEPPANTQVELIDLLESTPTADEKAQWNKFLRSGGGMSET